MLKSNARADTVQLDASDWTVEEQYKGYTIYKGSGRFAGEYLVRGKGTDKKVGSLSEAKALLQKIG